jgi:hypothetical protein
MWAPVAKDMELLSSETPRALKYFPHPVSYPNAPHDPDVMRWTIATV